MSGGPPTHVPPEHVSLVVQALPSSHGAVLGACTQPVAGSHESMVQTFPSSQLRAGPPVHRPFEQASPVVQALPSSQAKVFAACTHPAARSEEHTSELQSRGHLVCRLLLEKKKTPLSVLVV